MNQDLQSSTGGDKVPAEVVRRLSKSEAASSESSAGQGDSGSHAAEDSLRPGLPAEGLNGAAQQAAAEMQTAILDALPAHLALLDGQGVILAMNESWRRCSSANGFPGSEIAVGQNYLQLSEAAKGECSEEAAEVAAGIRRVLRGDVSGFTLDYPCHCSTERRWFRLMVNPLSRSGLVGAVVMHIDISDRKRAEEQLRESEARFRGTFEQAAVGIAHVSVEGRFLHVNEKLCAILGHTREELSGMTFTELTVPEDRAGGLEARRAMLAGEQSAYTTEKRYRHKDGQVVWVNLVTTPERSATGNPQYFISVFEDITPRKLAEFRLHRLNRLHTVLSRTGEAAVRTRTRQELYDSLCRIVVEDGRLRMALVLELEEVSGQVRQAARFGQGLDYLEELRITLEGPLSQGTIGSVLRSGTPDFCNDFANDPRMSPWRERAIQFGFLSTASFPLKLGEATIGVLTLFAGEVGYFQEDEIRLMTSVAGNVSFTLDALRKEQERQRVETALRASESSMAVAQQIAHFGSWELDLSDPDHPDSNSLRWSDEMFRIAGFEPRSVPVTNELFFSLVPSEEHEGIRQTLAAAIRDRCPYSFVHRLVRPDGEVRFVSETAQISFEEVSRRPHMMIGTAHDITERRMAEARIAEQAALIDEAHDAIILRDLEHRVIFWNRGAERVFGWTPKEALGRSFPDLVQVDPERFKEADRAVRTKGEWNGEIRKVGRKNSQLVFAARWTLLRDEQGNARAILSIDTDITERKKLEQQFLRAQRLESIGTLAGGIAHDLNNALSPIIMSMELLRLNMGEAERMEIISTMEASAQRCADMVRQVLCFARGVEGQKAVVQPAQLLREMQKMASETFPKNIEIKVRTEAGGWSVIGDPTQLHQVLLNLCVNARDAMPGGGTILLSSENVMLDESYAAMNMAAKAGPHVLLQVHDNGTGIPPEIIEKIFDPFFTTKEVGKGTGLGLSTSLAIINSHGGFVRVYSEPGRGTTFKVYLQANVHERTEEWSRQERDMPRGQGELILLVDDDVSVRQITRQTLEAFGYRVMLACDGAEAVALYAQNRTDIALVLTDMMMPVMDGPATIQVLMKLNPQIKIIAASGISANAHVAKAAGAGVTNFLPKPYTAETLLRMLRQVLVKKVT